MPEETQPEEIIIIEDSDAAAEAESDESHAQDEAESKSKKKKIIIISAAAAILLLLTAGGAFYFIKKKSHKKEEVVAEKIEHKNGEKTIEHIEPSKLENMIAKADYLYANGSKIQALELYEKIAQYSEAISAYNLGVAQLKDGQHKNALEAFKKAIQNNEKRCVSAINAAVCSLFLKDEEGFNYYINLAYAYLPQERASKLYSYYYALVNYYKGNYYEALSALKHPSSKDYAKSQELLGAKIDALLGNNHTAINSLEKNQSGHDDFALGLLYARVGDLKTATKKFNEAIKKNIEPMKTKIALGFVHLKNGQMREASKEIESATDKYGQEVYKDYPLLVSLKESLFDSQKAQLRYRTIINKSKSTDYQKIFYFSPYRVFNANQTINYIRKGNANIFIDNDASAQEYLAKGATSSSVNMGIVKAIQKALSFRLREANEMLQKLVEVQPKHSILHYNLALTYAQMGNMIDANKHFIRSYNLDAKNYLSGIYAVMTSQLISKDSTKLLSIIKEVIAAEEFNENIDLYKTLIYLAEGNVVSTADWLDRNYKQSPLYLALDVILAIKQNRVEMAQKSAKKLTVLLPDEIISHLLYIDAHFGDLKPKEYAKEVMNYLKNQKFSYNDLYYGAHITRYLFIQQNLITGKLYYLREQLKAALASANGQAHELTSALALASLYDKAFEESFVLYNNLIDNLKVNDFQTLLLGAVASVAASHHENAMALLELSKIKNPNSLESRYALGLLYIEAKNNKGATVQFSKIEQTNFNSEYFDFDINLRKLLIEKELSQNEHAEQETKKEEKTEETNTTSTAKTN